MVRAMEGASLGPKPHDTTFEALAFQSSSRKLNVAQALKKASAQLNLLLDLLASVRHIVADQTEATAQA